MSFLLKLFHFSLVKWLEDRALYISDADVAIIAQKLNVSPDVVKAINTEIANYIIAEVSKEL